MKNELADTAYMKDQQIEILKEALKHAAGVLVTTAGDQAPKEISKIRAAITASNKIEWEWRKEVA